MVTEDLRSFPRTHVGKLTASYSCSSRGFSGLFWPQRAPAFMCHTQYTGIYVRRNRNKPLEKLASPSVDRVMVTLTTQQLLCPEFSSRLTRDFLSPTRRSHWILARLLTSTFGFSCFSPGPGWTGEAGCLILTSSFCLFSIRLGITFLSACLTPEPSYPGSFSVPL